MVWRLIILDKSKAVFGVASVAIHAALLWLLLVCTNQAAPKKLPAQKLSLMAIYKKSIGTPFVQQTGPENQEKILRKPNPLKRFAWRRTHDASGTAQTHGLNQDGVEHGEQKDDAVEASEKNEVRAYPQLINGHDVHVPYPERARQLMIEGVVRLRLTISEAGKVIHAEVISGPAFGLRNAALKVARKLFFLPATDEHGQARVEQVDHDVVFRLSRQS